VAIFAPFFRIMQLKTAQLLWVGKYI